MENNQFVTIANAVKTFMEQFGFTIHDKGLPELIKVPQEQWTVATAVAAYAPEEHRIYILDGLTSDILNEFVAHELTHAYQDLSHMSEPMLPDNPDYWTCTQEREAYTVGFMYSLTYSTLESDKEAATKYISQIAEQIAAGNASSVVDNVINVYKNLQTQQTA